MDALAADAPRTPAAAGPAQGDTPGGQAPAGPVGPEAVHRILARWLRELSGPQVPLRPGGPDVAGATGEPVTDGPVRLLDGRPRQGTSRRRRCGVSPSRTRTTSSRARAADPSGGMEVRPTARRTSGGGKITDG